MAHRPIPVFIALALFAASIGIEAATAEHYRQWVEQMKSEPRGPFSQIRWFCEDGTVHPPKPYPCGERGGGNQHGEWSNRTVELREQGYKVANLLAGLDAGRLLQQPDFLDTYNQILIEKFLIGADDGWILREALFYRGAIQEEDEREGGRDLLLALAAKPEWLGLRYPALRIGVRMVPHGEDTASVQRVRQVSTALAEQDPGFQGLRSKIHGAPDAADADRVRDYAAGVQDPELKAHYQDLAAQIDRIHQAAPLSQLLDQEAAYFSRGPWLQDLLRSASRDYVEDGSAANHYRVTAKLLADLRDALPRIRSASARLRVLDLSLVVEAENFRFSTELRQQLAKAPREQRVAWLAAAANAAYGAGMINERERAEMERALSRLDTPEVPLEVYLTELRYLARVPGWGTQGLRFQFYDSMQKLGEIEPLALLFIQDQLRGSPLLFYSQVLDTLLRDGNALAGVHHKLFGEEVGVGFRALNPGLARGVLHARPNLRNLDGFRPDGIYLLPETVSDLPPVAGIMTAGEGNPLSHVQLLARNLGIPNVGVDENLIGRVQTHDGQRVVLAVSPAGLVELAEDHPRWDRVFGEDSAQQDVLIRPDLNKLDLSARDFLTLDDLRAADSGRIVGPKAAKLGELRHQFPEAVAPGVAIPFGTFREVVLNRPYRGGPQTVFDWMAEQYRVMRQLPAGSRGRDEFTERFRAELYDIILSTDPGDAFRQRLRAAMDRTFGPDGSYGVFVRSDTNVEDLAGFTGAGLNLTVPNVVGFDRVLKAINQVWASPFTARAFAWRQAHMDQPEHVYPAVLLLRSVPVDKSGVMVTQDIDSADPNIVSVAVNEGVGGAVDGQAAESLRIDTGDGSVRVLATATAAWRRVPSPKGGVDKLPVSGSESVLQPAEIRQLITLAKDLPRHFPAITDDRGHAASADIEFGFLDGQLRLFQIRPFLESRRARGSAYLASMDRALEGNLDKTVNTREVPGP